jgi:hypothetical protein
MISKGLGILACTVSSEALASAHGAKARQDCLHGFLVTESFPRDVDLILSQFCARRYACRLTPKRAAETLRGIGLIDKADVRATVICC